VGLEAARAEHRQAGRLLEREGWLEEALAAYARSEDWEGMARVLGSLGAEHTDLDDSWADALPPGVLESDPLLLMAQARSALSRGALAEAAQVLRRAEGVAGSAAVATRCRAQREQILAWIEPDRSPQADWLGAIRRATQRQPLDAARTAASLPGVTGRFAEGAAAFVAGDAARCSRVMRSVSAHPEASKAVAVAAGFLSAVCGVMVGRPTPDDVAERVREEVESSGLRWLGRVIRATLLSNDPAGDEAVDDLIGACERQGDHWGASAISAIAGLRRLMRGDRDAEVALAAAGDAFGRLGAGTLEAAVAGYAAVAAVGAGRAEQARVHAGRARSLGTALDVPVASALAALALGLLDRDDAALAVARQTFESLGTWSWHSALVGAIGADPSLAPAPGGAAAEVVLLPVPVGIRCFGGYELVIHGRRVNDAAVKPMERALLHLLSIRAGTTAHREILVDSLWPDADREAGLHRLQVAVSSLRRLLSAAGIDGNEVLVRAGDSYRLNLPEGSKVDVAEFGEAVTRAEAARAGRDGAAERLALDEAFALYAGPLLPGDGPAEWAVEPRRWLVGLYSDAAARLAAIFLEADDPRQAVRVARSGLAADRYRDDLWKLLIEGAEAAGNHAEAEQSRRDYETVLSDLGV
jgi:DNA-binding SARP family transcriptional activator